LCNTLSDLILIVTDVDDDNSSNGCSTGELPFMPAGLDPFCGQPVPEPQQMDDHIDADETAVDQEKMKLQRRREKSLMKRHRMSLWQLTSQTDECPLSSRKGLFRTCKSSICPSPKKDRTLSLKDKRDFFSLSPDPFEEIMSPVDMVIRDENTMAKVFLFVNDTERQCTLSLVCTSWAEAVTITHTIEISNSLNAITLDDDSDDGYSPCVAPKDRVTYNDDRTWEYLNTQFPWACFLSEGAFKRVYKVYNAAVGEEEALSVMDSEAIFDKKIVVSELVVSVLLSSLTRRGICPNFIAMHGSFTCPHAPPERRWGSSDCSKPNGPSFQERKCTTMLKQPKHSNPGRYRFIRMELCDKGDAEEYMKHLPGQRIDPNLARILLFQVAFALHAAANKFSMKHYDIKLLNIFLKRIEAKTDKVVLRYALGCHRFALQMNVDDAFFAKVADYGTANTKAESNGQPVTIAQFTTQENTPPDVLILGDAAKQGHGHDNFGLGLCFLHLCTGFAPYEEILEKVVCPPNLKKKLKRVWENDKVEGFKVLQTCILSDVYKDEVGHIIEGDPDETLYDTFYRYLVLFGIPEPFQQNDHPAVWKAVTEALMGVFIDKNGHVIHRKQGTDIAQYGRDRNKFSIHYGTNEYIARARNTLDAMPGGMDLLFQLCHFDPSCRATALDVMNSTFMAPLRESAEASYDENTTVYSYLAFSTQK
jgi:serine/threonine protein kinase